MKKFLSLLIIALLLVIGYVDTAFAKSEIVSQQTQLQKRQYQTREYNNISKVTVMKAMLNVLQDEDFIVDNANTTLGFISGTKEFNPRDKSVDVRREFGTTKGLFFASVAVVEATANVSEFGKQVRVRINFKRKLLNDYGNANRIEEVTDPEYYQNFFSRVDKAMFIQKQKI